MRTETIIKLIGHRPVYRVEQGRAAILREKPECFRGRMPVIDRNHWNRPLAGSDISKPAG